MVKIEQRELIGKTFNGLTIVSFSHTDGKKDMYNCNCHCGSQAVLEGIAVKNARVLTCGCNKDYLYIGKKHHYLTLNSRSHRDRWMVTCVCGNEFNVSGHWLRRSHIKSCGCKRSKFEATTMFEYGCINLDNMKKIVHLKSTALILQAARLSAGKEIYMIPKNICPMERYFRLEEGAEMSDRELTNLTAYFGITIGTFAKHVMDIEEYLVKRIQEIGMESEMSLLDLIDTLIKNKLAGHEAV